MDKTVICKDVDLNEYQISVSELSWRPSAYGIVIKDDHVLLSRQFGRYDLPGGGVDLGEPVEAAVIREVKEETGITVNTPRVVGVENSFFKSTHGNNKSYHSILMYYICDFVGGELSIEGFDEYEKQYAELAEWVPLITVDTLETASTVDFRPYIKQAAAIVKGGA